MSATNWAQCPRCETTAVEKQCNAIAAIKESYGKIPEDEYCRLIQQARKPLDIKDTLREDYELGVNPKGEFWMYYSCSCDCGYGFNYRHKQQTEL